MVGYYYELSQILVRYSAFLKKKKKKVALVIQNSWKYCPHTKVIIGLISKTVCREDVINLLMITAAKKAENPQCGCLRPCSFTNESVPDHEWSDRVKMEHQMWSTLRGF